MALTYADVSRATLQIVCGDTSGSGFHFLRPDIVATSYHVVADDASRVNAIAEDGASWALDLLSSSAEDEYDFAIFRVSGKVGNDRVALLPPDDPELPEPGREVVLSGFPHGISDLLVQRGIVAGHDGEDGFYIDASVSGGNSGGPAIDLARGRVVGQVYSGRFLGAPKLEQLLVTAERFALEWQASISRLGEIDIQGINFGALASAVAQSNMLLAESLLSNANTGIGIARDIAVLVEACEENGVI